MRRFLAVAALAALAIAPARGDAPMPYVFTQAHGGTSQRVAAGAALQVQLPAGPALWRFDAERSYNVRPLGTSFAFSPGRIPETEAIQVLDFEGPLDGPARLVIRTDALPVALRRTLPDGVFAIALLPAAE